jgi:prepilin-type N-terminal cleavage/methylation domain-containing protein
MKKMKRLQKGFTLIELLIVLAIFSIIMVLVMSFIDPVSNVMKKASTRERTASYVDNINEYLEKSMRYAQYVRVFEGNFCNNTAPSGDPDNTYDVFAEDKAVQQFVDDYFDGAISSEYEMAGTLKIYKPLTGKVHVLKFCNDHMLDSDDKPGTIYETVYDFTAGESVLYQMVGPSSIDEETGEEIGGEVTYVRRWSDDDDPEKTKSPDYHDGSAQVAVLDQFKHSVVTAPAAQTNVKVINPEHFKDFSYYYQIGDFSFDSLKPADITNYGLSDPGDGYYSMLNRLGSGFSTSTSNSKQWFQLCTVTYQNNNKGNNMIEATNSETSEKAKVFLSPSYMNMSGSYLINGALSTFANKTDYYRYSRAYGTKDKKDDAGKYTYAESDTEKSQPLIAPIKLDDDNGKSSPMSSVFTHYKAKLAAGSESDNIYFIYVVPREVNNNVDVIGTPSDDEEEEEEEEEGE